MNRTLTFITLCFAIIMLPAKMMAEGKNYLDFKIGYGVQLAQNYQYSVNTTNNSGVSTYELQKGSGSLGRGFQTNLFGGHYLNEHFAAELGVGYFRGNPVEAYNVSNQMMTTNRSEWSYRASGLRVMPGVRFEVPACKMKLYTRGGMVIGAGNRIKVGDSYSYVNMSFPAFNQTQEEESVLYGRMSLGLYAYMGLLFKICESADIFAEFGMISHSWSPGKCKTTKYTVNGEDKMSDLKTSDKETEYVDEYTQEQNPDPSKPSKEIRRSFNLSSTSFDIGIHYKF